MLLAYSPALDSPLPRCTSMSASSPSNWTSNGLPIAAGPEHVAHLSETCADGDVLRDQYQRDGYALLRGVVPRDTILALRKAYLGMFPAEMLRDGDAERGAFSGIMVPGLPAHGVSGHPAHGFVRSSAFREFADSPVFSAIASSLLGGPVKRVPRTPLRHFIKGSNRASRAHADRTYLDEPEASCVTLWVPLGDCPTEAGSLIYLEGSHRSPGLEDRLREEAPSDRSNDRRPISHDLAWVASRAQSRWLVGDFRAGDVVAHVPTIIHASLDPMSDVMRVSTDLRFLRADVPVDPRWQQDWSADDGY